MSDHHEHGENHAHDLSAELADLSTAEFWDKRYSEAGEVMWSGNPNGTVEVELADLAPGRALDVACGEGADAMWLADRGWEVTAVDVSPVAIERARAAAAKAANAAASGVTWEVADVLTDPPPSKAYDLVLMMYPAFHHPVEAATIRALADSVAPGGTLLAVHHVVPPEVAEEHGWDPSQFVSIAEIADALAAGSDFTVEIHETRSRPDPPADSHHSDDEVLRLRRSG